MPSCREGIVPNATYPLIVIRGTAQSVPVPVTVTELQPGAYTVNTSGSGAGIVTNALTGQLISTSNPAHAGDFLVMYATGVGALIGQNGETPPGDGAPAPTDNGLPYRRKPDRDRRRNQHPGAVLRPDPDIRGTLSGKHSGAPRSDAGSAVPINLTATDPATGVTAAGNTVTVAIQ